MLKKSDLFFKLKISLQFWPFNLFSRMYFALKYTLKPFVWQANTTNRCNVNQQRDPNLRSSPQHHPSTIDSNMTDDISLHILALLANLFSFPKSTLKWSIFVKFAKSQTKQWMCLGSLCLLPNIRTWLKPDFASHRRRNFF